MSVYRTIGPLVFIIHSIVCLNPSKNSVDPNQEQSDLDLHCLPRLLIHPKALYHYNTLLFAGKERDILC